MNVDVNFFAIFVSAVASMAVGFVWYSPILFGKPWMKIMGYTSKNMKKMQEEMGMTYGVSFILSLITAYVLTQVMAISMNFFHYSAIETALSSAFWMWIGFVAPVQATDALFGKKNWSLFVINSGYQLAGLLAMGIVLAIL